MEKLLVICGSTATGKTALGIKLAKKFNSELVSADSRQVYRGMDIGTGKDLPVNSKLKTQNSKLNLKSKNLTIGFYEIEGVKLWLYDVVEPDYKFSVADYVKCANLVIQNIWQRKKLPILVGGTGFYIKGVVDGIETIGVPPDWELRKKLLNCSIAQLLSRLGGLDPERLARMNESDKNNPRRLIRAIEIALQSQKANIKKQKYIVESEKIDILIVGLLASYKELYRRIDQRVEKRVKQGIGEEIRKLLKKGYSFDNSALGTTIGYREWRQYFIEQNIYKRVRSGEPISIYSSLVKDAIQRWKFAEHRLARRQMTWFKKDKRICWFDITKQGWQDKVEQLVRSWYNSNAFK